MPRQVAYIDTEHTFRPDRIRPIAARFGLDADAVLDNVCHAYLSTSWGQSDQLTRGIKSHPTAAQQAPHVIMCHCARTGWDSAQPQRGRMSCHNGTWLRRSCTPGHTRTSTRWVRCRIMMSSLPARCMTNVAYFRSSPPGGRSSDVTAVPCLPAELLTPLAAKMVEEPFKLLIMDRCESQMVARLTVVVGNPQGRWMLGLTKSRCRKRHHYNNDAVWTGHGQLGYMSHALTAYRAG